MQSFTPDDQWEDKIVASLDIVGFTHIFNFALKSHNHQKNIYDLNKIIIKSIKNSLKKHNMDVCVNVFKHTGDGALLVFKTANEASIFASTAHYFFSLNKLDIRIGIDYGDAIIMRDHNECIADVFGGCVIDAVRFEAECSSGHTFVSKTVYKMLDSNEKLKYNNKPKTFLDKHKIQHTGYESKKNRPLGSNEIQFSKISNQDIAKFSVKIKLIRSNKSNEQFITDIENRIKQISRNLTTLILSNKTIENNFEKYNEDNKIINTLIKLNGDDGPFDDNHEKRNIRMTD